MNTERKTKNCAKGARTFLSASGRASAREADKNVRAPAECQAQTNSMKRQLNTLRQWAAALLAGLGLIGQANGDSSTGLSSVFTVDLSSATITVSGRVLDAKNRAPVSAATVTLAGQTTSSSGAGLFSFDSVSLTSGNTLTVSKSGYMTATEAPSVPAGSKSVTMPDILLQAAVANKPVVTRVESRLKGIFLSGASMNNDFTASVNWNGLSPGYVRFYANEAQVADQTGSGPDYVCTIDMAGASFHPAYSVSANSVKVVAVSGGGQASAPYVAYVGILPLPDAIKLLAGQNWPFTTYLDGHIGVDYDFPNPPISAVLNLPIIGRYGFEIAGNGSFDYTVTDGDWEAAVGVGAEGTQGKRGQRPGIPGLARHPKLKLYIGNQEISGKLQAGLRGTATIQKGITFDECFGHAEIEARLELGRFGLLDLLGPGLSSAVGRVPGLRDVVKTVSLIIWVIPGVEGDLTVAFHPKLAFDSLEMTGKVGLEAAYEPELGGSFKLRAYIGGEPSVTLQVPGDLFKNVRFKAYAGAKFEAWFLTFGPVEYVFVDVTYPAGLTAEVFPLGNGACSVAKLKVLRADAADLSPSSRAYREAGPELFLASESAPRYAGQLGPSGLDAFRQLGQSPVRGSVMAESAAPAKPGGTTYTPRFGEPGSGTNQADLTLVQNAYPNSSPAMAARGTELMLLYVTDNGITNSLQYTDIAWTRWDGTNWSVPLAIRTNTQAEFAPQVAYDGNGDAIAAWERVADPNFNQTNLTAMAQQMEIVWSRWSRASGMWSEPVALTANSYLDHAPLLCGPMANGNVLLTWTKNEANLLMGTNGPGADTVLWAEWSAASRSWTTPKDLVSGLAYRRSQSLAGATNRAVYAWTRDVDGVLTNDADQEVFFMVYTNSVWGAVRQLTTNSVADKNVRVAVAANGNVFLVWQSGTNLVLSRNYSTNVSLVRADSQTAGFADYTATVGPLGHLVLLWQEMSVNGSDAHYAVYDPVADGWSRDDLLCQDPPLERSFAPVWDAQGNLTVAYNKVQILHTNMTLTVEGGGSVTVSNVPQSGRVDLVVTKRALVKDLELAAGDFTVGGVNYLPGDPLALSATVRNRGNVAMSNVVVGFYDGNPDTGGVLLTNVTLPGWLEAAGTNVASAVWVVPEPATNHTLYAVANRAGLAGEFNGSNNVQSVRIGGTDLTVGLVSYQAETNGAVRVIAQVQNLGAPTAAKSVLAIRQQGQTNAPLATVAVPVLEPGRLAQLALDLPAGTQPSGEQLYTLTADETHVTSDVDTNNNTAAFAVNLWIDSDADGLPDNWMIQYFGHATGQASDLSQAQDDADSDGVSNLAEYLAGTNPKDPHSYLSLTGIGLGGTNGVQIAWGSAPNKLYSLQRAVVLSGGLGFTNIAEHILSTPPENVYLDASATNRAAFFYRIRVE